MMEANSIALTNASGLRPCSAAADSLMRTTDAAPTVKGLELPAVSVPVGPGSNTGGGLASFSILVVGRTIVSPVVPS